MDAAILVALVSGAGICACITLWLDSVLNKDEI